MSSQASSTVTRFTHLAAQSFRSNVPMDKRNVTLRQAMSGYGPYAGTMMSAVTAEFLENHSARLARYRNAWDFYQGDHYESMYEDGTRKAVVNFVKLVSDIAVNWFVADGWTTKCPSGNEMIAELLNMTWDANNGDVLMQTLALFGAVTGDAFCYVTVKTNDDDNQPLPKDKWTVRLLPLNPAHCFPIWSPTNPGEMLRLFVQFPLLHPDNNDQRVLLTLVIDKNNWEVWYDDELKVRKPNPFGMVNVVHIPNFINPTECWGQSDIHSVISVNEDYNDTLNSIRRIMKYHGEPTTLIFGARVSDMERGAKKVWSGLPVEARVENLELKADLAANYNILREHKDNLAVLSQTPRTLLFSETISMSNTSGLAMQMTFQPLIEKTRKRQATYTEGLKKVNKLILLAHELIIGTNIAMLADFPERRYESVPRFTSPLPRDEKTELDAAQMKLTMGIWSRAEAIRQLSNTAEQERLTIELMADDRYNLARAYELQRANSGFDPNLSVVFLNSSTLSEEIEPLADQTLATDEEASAKDAEDDSKK